MDYRSFILLQIQHATHPTETTATKGVSIIGDEEFGFDSEDEDTENESEAGDQDEGEEEQDEEGQHETITNDVSEDDPLLP